MLRLPVAQRVLSSVLSCGPGRRSALQALFVLAIAGPLSGACGTAGNGNGASGSGGTSGNSGAAGNSGSSGTAGSGGSGQGSGSADSGSGSGASGGTQGGMDTGTSGSAGGGGTSGTEGGLSDSGDSGGVSSSDGGGSVYNPNFVEFSGSDCTVATPTNVNITYLPNLFTNLDGSTVSKRSDWRCRRAELKAIVEKYIEGAKPPPPQTVTGTVSATEVTVHVENMGTSIDFTLPVTIPSGAKQPVPAVIDVGASSIDSAVTAQGVALMNFDNDGMDNEANRMGLFTNIYGNTGASALIGWAWGVSRVIDVLISEKAAGRNNIIDPTAIGVSGCSRDGKGAFIVGAFDERIALGLPCESGTGGVSAFRIVNTAPVGPNGNPAQSLQSASETEVGWFGTVFQPYINTPSMVNTIPGDTSSIAAMYAPRGLLVIDNSRIGELGASAQDGACEAAGFLYKALGIPNNIAYNGGQPTDPQGHCDFAQDPAADAPLQAAIAAFLNKTTAPMGQLQPAAVATANLTTWVPWGPSAPTLVNDLSWASAPLQTQ